MTKEAILLLSIMASPRQNGNSAWLAEDLFREPMGGVSFEHVDYRMSGKTFSHCLGCLGCYRNGGNCVIADDFTELKSLWGRADAILYVLPVYHLGAPGQLKSFIDRLGNTFHGVPPRRQMKAIGAVAQGGLSMGGQELTNLYLMSHALIMHSFFVIGDKAQLGIGMVSGRGGNRNSFREKAASKEEMYAADLETARNMIRRLVEMAAILRAGSRALKETIVGESVYEEILSRPDVKLREGGGL